MIEHYTIESFMKQCNEIIGAANESSFGLSEAASDDFLVDDFPVDDFPTDDFPTDDFSSNSSAEEDSNGIISFGNVQYSLVSQYVYQNSLDGSNYKLLAFGNSTSFVPDFSYSLTLEKFDAEETEDTTLVQMFNRLLRENDFLDYSEETLLDAWNANYVRSPVQSDAEALLMFLRIYFFAFMDTDTVGQFMEFATPALVHAVAEYGRIITFQDIAALKAVNRHIPQCTPLLVKHSHMPEQAAAVAAAILKYASSNKNASAQLQRSEPSQRASMAHESQPSQGISLTHESQTAQQESGLSPPLQQEAGAQPNAHSFSVVERITSFGDDGRHPTQNETDTTDKIASYFSGYKKYDMPDINKKYLNMAVDAYEQGDILYSDLMQFGVVFLWARFPNSAAFPATISSFTKFFFEMLTGSIQCSLKIPDEIGRMFVILDAFGQIKLHFLEQFIFDADTVISACTGAVRVSVLAGDAGLLLDCLGKSDKQPNVIKLKSSLQCWAEKTESFCVESMQDVMKYNFSSIADRYDDSWEKCALQRMRAVSFEDFLAKDVMLAYISQIDPELSEILTSENTLSLLHFLDSSIGLNISLTRFRLVMLFLQHELQELLTVSIPDASILKVKDLAVSIHGLRVPEILNQISFAQFLHVIDQLYLQMCRSSRIVLGYHQNLIQIFIE